MINPKIDNQIFDSILTEALKERSRIYLSNIPSENELSMTLEFSDEFKVKMSKLMKKYKIMTTRKKTFNYIKKIVASILIVAGLAFGVLISSQPVRSAIQNVIIQWFDKYTQFEFQSDSTGIVEPREYILGYLPDGFVESDNLTFKEFDLVIHEYEDLKGNNIIFEYSSTTEDYSINLDNEHSTYSVINLKGSEAHVFESNEEGRRSYLIWEHDSYTFKLVSNLTINEIIRIAEDVKQLK